MYLLHKKKVCYILYAPCHLALQISFKKKKIGLFHAESHDETRIEELHKKRNYLAAYCKLVVYNVIPIKSAADIFKHYLRVSLTFKPLLAQ